VGKETLHITNIFRKTDVKIAFRTSQNSIPDHQHPWQHHRQILQIWSIQTKLPRLPQGVCGTDRETIFRMLQGKHLTSFHKKNSPSNYSKHLNEAGQSFGPILDIMEILHCQGKGRHLNTVEKFHIYAEFAANDQLSDPQTHSPNAIFDILTKAHRRQ
jgi:hypothetical protein